MAALDNMFLHSFFLKESSRLKAETLTRASSQR